MSKMTKTEKAPKLSALEKAFPPGFAPQPTVYPGGFERMVQCWTALRALNTGGWGARRLVSVEGWNFKEHLGDTIACSPFTGTVIAMLFDPKGDPNGTHFKPLFDGDRAQPLPRMFYDFHNTSLADAPKPGRISNQEAFAQLAKAGNKAKAGMASRYSCTGAAALWNLGYEIDPRDARRGDLLHFDRIPKPGKHSTGHATFCWDVHLNAIGEVDCFLIVAANGDYGGGAGISVSASPTKFFFDSPGGKYRVKSAFTPYFIDRPEFVERGNWKLVPGFGYTEAAVRKAGTFKVATPKSIGEVKKCHVLRFWGFPPPDRKTPRGQAAWADLKYSVNFSKAAELAKYTLAEPYCMGTGRSAAVTIAAVPAVSLRAEHLQRPEDIQRVATRPVVQRAEDATPEQLEVERSLDALFRAGILEVGPGNLDNVHDAETVNAIKAFQRRFGLKADGIAGGVTRPLLFRAAEDVRAGRTQLTKPPAAVAQPTTKPPPKAPATPPVILGPLAGSMPRIDRFYLLHNHATPGASLTFVVEGRDLDVWRFSPGQISFVETTRGTRVDVATPIPFTHGGRGEASVVLPPEMTAGTVWRVTLHCQLLTGILRVECPIELTLDVRHPAEPAAATDGWPWDEAPWPKALREIVRELRETPKPTDLSAGEPWAISTYGVKEKLDALGPRDRKTKELRYADGGTKVPVLSPTGKVLGEVTRYSLFAADIEGTMRLGTQVLNIKQTGRPRGGSPPHRYEEFDPSRSQWYDVTQRRPWGSGSKAPLIPYRVLAINKRHDGDLYFQKVYIKALDGMRLPPTGEIHNGICLVGDCGSMDPRRQFDFFKGRQDITFKIRGDRGTFKNSKGVSLPDCTAVFLGECAAARAARRHR